MAAEPKCQGQWNVHTVQIHKGCSSRVSTVQSGHEQIMVVLTMAFSITLQIYQGNLTNETEQDPEQDL